MESLTHVWAAGIMFSRSMEAKGGVIESVRLLIQFTRHAPRDDAETADDGYRSEKTRQMVRFLELLHWTGDFDEFDRIDDHFLDDGGLGSVLQVDVLDVEPAAAAPSVIGPRRRRDLRRRHRQTQKHSPETRRPRRCRFDERRVVA